MRLPSASRLRRINAHHRAVRRELYALLIDTIHEYVHKAALGKQDRVAMRLGTTQQRVSLLFAGRLDLFNSETLIAMLQRFGVKVGVTVVERRRVRLHDRPGPH